MQGVLGDLWRPEERGKAASLYSLGPLLGPAVGPVAGGWIAQRVPNDGYRWVFFSTTIVRGWHLRILLGADLFSAVLRPRSAPRITLLEGDLRPRPPPPSSTRSQEGDGPPEGQ